MTTSTIYSTQLITVTACPTTVTSCPASHTSIITSVVVVSTTVCPVAEVTPQPQPPVHIPVVSQPAPGPQPPSVTVSAQSSTYYAIVSQPQYGTPTPPVQPPTTPMPQAPPVQTLSTYTNTVTCTEVSCEVSTSTGYTYIVQPSYPPVVSQPTYYPTSNNTMPTPITQNLPQFTGGASANKVGGAIAGLGFVVAALL